MRAEEQGSLPTPTAKCLPEFEFSPVLPSVRSSPGRQCRIHLFSLCSYS